MADVMMNVERRESRGKGPAKVMRRQGRIPGILYGDGKEPVALSVDPKVVETVLLSATGMNTIFELELAGTGQRRPAMIHEYQRHPVKQSIEHVDFVRINMSRKIHVKVHIKIEGLANGVKNQGGILEFLHREVALESLPGDIPREIAIDVSHLNVGQSVRVADLKLDPAKLRVLDDPETVIAVVAIPAAEKEAAPVAEAAVAEAPAEPAVIKKGKEKEGEAAEAKGEPAKSGKADKPAKAEKPEKK